MMTIEAAHKDSLNKRGSCDDRRTKLLTTCLLITVVVWGPSQAHSGVKTKPFPGVEYTYVKAYMLNLGKHTMEGHIFDGRAWARSKIGDGVTVDPKLVESFNQVVSRDMKPLLAGLSKCFIPRHGLVYYDSEHKPVASITICFECEGLRLYPKTQKPSWDPPPSERDVKRAFKYLARLKYLMGQVGFPVYERRAQYVEYLKNSAAYKSGGTVELKLPGWYQNVFGPTPSLTAVKSALARIKLPLLPPVVRPTDGPVSYSSEGVTAIVDRTSSKLLRAAITTPEFRLQNGVSVGLSWLDFKRSLGAYEGPENPKTVTITGARAEYLVRLKFNERTLRRIEIQKIETERKSTVKPDAGPLPTAP